MPIYEFKCQECEKSFSELRNIGDDKGVICPHCKSENTKKLISTFSSHSKSSAPSCSPSGGG